MLDFTGVALTKLPTHKALTTVAGQWVEVKIDARVGRLSFKPAADVLLSMAALSDEAAIDLETQEYVDLDAGEMVEYNTREDLSTGCPSTKSYFVGHESDVVRVVVVAEVG